MDTITVEDGTRIFYKDWGSGRPVVFSHGWPLSSDAWDAQMMFLGTRGYRVIAHDRRGHGRSEPDLARQRPGHLRRRPGGADRALDLRDALLVGHSTGGGEVARYIGRHGTTRVAKAVLIGCGPAADAEDR